ncbi:hypothetical protein NP493_665g00025 [Ridgeia piscesae]|uniref:DUF4832 domain-containing protein n=1 Tax=Ridgeia piscesae TaxID=27915 RepID=A0AAD9KRW2_RIDPI|nr:hypothetical protein NP493_665g00025 [Ridgeia piscesae]
MAMHRKSECPTATKELRELHFSYLNQDYNKNVYKLWKDDGCFHEIDLHLGYRLVLKKAILPQRLEQGGKFCFHLELENTGFAAPFKQKTLHVMLRNKNSADLFSADLTNYDLRTWLSGETVTIDDAVYLPIDLPTGTYEVMLAIKDKLSPLVSDYNILLAINNDVAERKKGLNSLNHDVTYDHHNSIYDHHHSNYDHHHFNYDYHHSNYDHHHSNYDLKIYYYYHNDHCYTYYYDHHSSKDDHKIHYYYQNHCCKDHQINDHNYAPSHDNHPRLSIGQAKWPPGGHCCLCSCDAPVQQDVVKINA